MWELRTRARIHTSSSLMCWAACDRLAKIAARARPARARRALARARRHASARKILEQAWSEKRQAFVESFGGSELDASVLLMAEVGFIAAERPALRQHRRGAGDDAVRRPVHAPLRGAPTTSASPRPRSTSARSGASTRSARIGRPRRGARGLRGAAGAPQPAGPALRGHAPGTGELWGNFPQTYSMVGIINGAVRLSAPWDSVV